jgi:hypothetical protein
LDNNDKDDNQEMIDEDVIEIELYNFTISLNKISIYSFFNFIFFFMIMFGIGIWFNNIIYFIIGCVISFHTIVYMKTYNDIYYFLLTGLEDDNNDE